MADGAAAVDWRFLTIWLAAVAALVVAVVSGNAIALIPLVIVPSLLVHECGHALAARLTGFEILVARIGNGPNVLRAQLAGTPLELRLFPLTGMVAALTPTPKALRIRVALYAAAGVCTAVGVAAVVYPFAGQDLRVALVAASIVQALNLLPVGFRLRGTPRASDGLLIGKAIFGPLAALQERYVAPLLRQHYLQQIQRDPAAAAAIGRTYQTLAVDAGEGTVMVTCVYAGTGQPVATGRLTTLWETTTPGWTDMLLAWCTDKTVRDAIAGATVTDAHIALMHRAITRVPDSPELESTLARACQLHPEGAFPTPSD